MQYNKGFVERTAVSSGNIEELLTQLWKVKECFPKDVMAQLSPKRPVRVTQAKKEEAECTEKSG